MEMSRGLKKKRSIAAILASSASADIAAYIIALAYVSSSSSGNLAKNCLFQPKRRKE